MFSKLGYFCKHNIKLLNAVNEIENKLLFVENLGEKEHVKF